MPRARLAALVALVALTRHLGASDTGTIYATLAEQKENAVLTIAVKEAHEVGTLTGTTLYTLFAPTDAAFKKLGDATIDLIAAKPETVKKLVRAHLVPGKYTAEALRKKTGESLPTLGGTRLKIEDRKDGLYVNGAKIVTADLGCSNGVIHTLDGVLPVPNDGGEK